MTFWRRLFGIPHTDEQLERRRDPDLDYVKHIAEDHEYRIQLMENELERVSGGHGCQLNFKGKERRDRPRH